MHFNIMIMLYIEGIISTNGLIVAWMDYPENTNIIDPKNNNLITVTGVLEYT